MTIRTRKGPKASRPFADLTLQIMQDFGAQACWTDDNTLQVKPTGYQAAQPFQVEPEAKPPPTPSPQPPSRDRPPSYGESRRILHSPIWES